MPPTATVILPLRTASLRDSVLPAPTIMSQPISLAYKAASPAIVSIATLPVPVWFIDAIRYVITSVEVVLTLANVESFPENSTELPLVL